jgi:transcriptional regulator with XRE-family HTH domain
MLLLSLKFSVLTAMGRLARGCAVPFPQELRTSLSLDSPATDAGVRMVVKEVSMPETLGARLRQRREERGIALVTIAQQTKIKESLLEGLEKEDLSQWPSKLYRRAFVRAYARAIGLDPEVVVQEFLQAHPDPPEVDVIEAMSSVLVRGDGHARRIRKAVGSALGSLSRRPAPAMVHDRGPDRVVTPASLIQAPAAVPETPSPAPAPAPVDSTASASAAPAEHQPDLLAVARLCTEFGRVEDMTDVPLLLEEAARLLDAKGLIVWLWDPAVGQLTPSFVHGYSDRVVAHLPTVRRDADNPTAAAFRTAEAHTCGNDPHPYGALVVPLLTANGCAGVLALELQRGREGTPAVMALATIVASHLAPIPGRSAPADLVPQARLAVGGA